MPNTINGTYTLKQVLSFTRDQYKSRFDYVKRDKLKFIRVKKIQYYSDIRPGNPTVLYEIQTQSTPQYKPYVNAKDKRGRFRRSQRSIRHDYDCILQMDKLSLNTIYWRGAVGKLKKIRPAPQAKIAQIRRETMEKWKKRYKTKELLDKVIRRHRRQAKYLSEGDYQAQEHGINLDFIYRCMFAWKFHGHLYQLGGYIENRPSKLNTRNIVFFPKHFILLIKAMMEHGIIKDD